MIGSTIDVSTPDGVADCYLTRPADDRAYPGVLLVMDAIGLRPRIEEMADRIADQGYVVLAPNVFYRAGRAPLWETPDLHDPESRVAFFRTLGPLMRALTPDAVAADGGAYLAKLSELTDGPVGVTGYCFGGWVGWTIGAAYPDRVTAIGGFHTGRMVTDDASSAHLLAPRVRGEVYWGHADQDESMTAENIARSTGRWTTPVCNTPPSSTRVHSTATRWPTWAPTTRRLPSGTSRRYSHSSSEQSGNENLRVLTDVRRSASCSNLTCARRTLWASPGFPDPIQAEAECLGHQVLATSEIL